jgi:hypothetical protein
LPFLKLHAMPKNYDRPSGPPLARSPDGRLWISLGNTRGISSYGQPRVWRALNIPNPSGETEGRVLAEDRQYISLRKTPVRVEVDFGSPERSRRVANQLAAGLKEQGIALGPAGWVLQMSHKVEDSLLTLQGGLSGQEGMKVPKVLFTLALLDPEGKQVWQEESEGLFAQMGSRYYLKSRQGGLAVGTLPGTRTDYYDFGKQGMRTAVVNEILDTRALGVKLSGSIAPWMLKAGGSYCKLPLSLELPGTLKP